jgi:putative transposase
VPIAVVVSEANRHDMKKLGELLDATVLEPPVVPAGAPPEERPQLCLDRGYAYDHCRQAATSRGYVPHIPPKASAAQPLPPPGDTARHPARRWVVEVAHSWFNRFRRLLIRWDKRKANYLGFLQLAACLIVYRKVRQARALSG